MLRRRPRRARNPRCRRAPNARERPVPPAQSPIDTYLASLGRELRRRGVRAEDFVAEARDHLDEAARSNLERGCPADIAELEAISRFGSPATAPAIVPATELSMFSSGFFLPE